MNENKHLLAEDREALASGREHLSSQVGKPLAHVRGETIRLFTSLRMVLPVYTFVVLKPDGHVSHVLLSSSLPFPTDKPVIDDPNSNHKEIRSKETVLPRRRSGGRNGPLATLWSPERPKAPEGAFLSDLEGVWCHSAAGTVTGRMGRRLRWLTGTAPMRTIQSCSR